VRLCLAEGELKCKTAWYLFRTQGVLNGYDDSL